MYDEDDLLPISALQHLLFCKRQCALIHVEGTWMDNALTVEGTHLHRRADEGPSESRKDLVVVRAVPVRSLHVGLTGRADVVEFRRVAVQVSGGASLPGRDGRWSVRPVEYKRGKPKSHRADEVQLCAQAICLEEMLHTTIDGGDLYYGARRRRTEVRLDAKLRRLTLECVEQLRDLLRGERTPRAQFEPKCDSCSLQPVCMPKLSSDAHEYLRRAIHRGAAG